MELSRKLFKRRPPMRILSLKSYLVFSLALLLLIIGCGEDRDGFGVRLWYEISVTSFQLAPLPANIRGSWLSDNAGAVGTSYGFVNRWSGDYILNGRAPARWEITVSETLNPPMTPCWGRTAVGNIKSKTYNQLICGFFFSMRSNFDISPQTIAANSTTNITVTGEGISGTYGMPIAFVMNTTGVILGEATASSCTPGWMNGTVYIPSVPSGNYVLMISNRTQSGGYEDIGGVEFYIEGGPPVCDPTGELAADCASYGGIFNYTTCHCDCACG
jgi:hypothetical protein